MTGVVKRIVVEKGFGFIRSGNTEYFFHRSSVQGGGFESLREGQAVTFEQEEGPKGPRAGSVRAS